VLPLLFQILYFIDLGSLPFFLSLKPAPATVFALGFLLQAFALYFTLQVNLSPTQWFGF
jgi:hypothetical protein